MKRRHIVLLGILAVLVLAALIYTRPMTLQELCGLALTRRVTRASSSQTTWVVASLS